MGPPRLAGLDALRAFAFLAVYVHHALGAPMLWAGVDVFFVLSGFLITGILRRTRDLPGTLRTFYGRRFLRIFPPYYLVLAILLIVAPTVRPAWPWLASYTSNLHDAFAEGPRLTAPMWSLAIEEQFYLVWPLLVLATGRRGLAWVCGGVIVGAFVGRLLGSLAWDDWRPIYHLTLLRLDLLAAGGLVALALEDGAPLEARVRRGALVAVAAAGLAFVALALTRPDFRTSAGSPLFDSVGYALVAVVAVGVLLIALTAEGGLARLLGHPALQRLGAISYVTYLIHVPMIELTSALLGSRPRPLIGLVALAGTLLAAEASRRWFETPLATLKERWFGYPSRPV